ncbi:MAG: hypothetical protein RL071_2440 [Pseudomonadota bacterium]|jgi:ATP-binding cassette subfamily B protein
MSPPPPAAATAPAPRGAARAVLDPIIRLLRRYAWAHRWRYLGGLATLGLTNWLTVEIPLSIGLALDRFRAGEALGGPVAAVVVMGALVIVVRTLSRVLVFNPGRDIERDLRDDIFRDLLARRASFFARHTTGDIISRAANDITYARAVVGFGLMQAVNVSMALVMTGWKMWDLSPLLTVLSAVPITVGLIIVQQSSALVMSLHRRSQEQLGELSEHVLSSFQGIATIQGFAAEPRFIERFEDKATALLRTRMRGALLGGVAFPSLLLAGSLSIFVLLYVGGPMAITGELSVGEVAAFATLLGILLPPLRSMGWMLSVFQRGSVSIQRIFDLLDTPHDQPEGPDAAPAPVEGAPWISVDGLTVAYPEAPDKKVLQDLRFTVPAGAVVGIFGRTGSGKTTLLKVLARLLDPPAGAVRVGSGPGRSADLRGVQLRAWQDLVCMAWQRPFLFSETIADNVEVGPRGPVAELDRALSLAALRPDLSSFPAGVETVVGERGVMLSGGQRQRVALARALRKLARRPGGLLLLDDVLSAVDHETEAQLVGALRSLGAGGVAPTTFIVSHRVSALRHADLVLVLDEGRLVDQGPPGALTEREGPFREAWLAQLPRGEEPAAATVGGAL